MLELLAGFRGQSRALGKRRLFKLHLFAGALERLTLDGNYALAALEGCLYRTRA